MVRFVFFALALAACGPTNSPLDMKSVDSTPATCDGVASDGAACSAEGAICPGPCGPCALSAFAPRSCSCTNGHWVCNHVDCSPFCYSGGPATYVDSSCSTLRTCQDAGSDAGSDGGDMR